MAKKIERLKFSTNPEPLVLTTSFAEIHQSVSGTDVSDMGIVWASLATSTQVNLIFAIVNSSDIQQGDFLTVGISGAGTLNTNGNQNYPVKIALPPINNSYKYRAKGDGIVIWGYVDRITN